MESGQFLTVDNEQKTSTSMIVIPYLWEYHIIRRGLCLLYSQGSPEPHNNNKLKFPRLIFIRFYLKLGSMDLKQDESLLIGYS